jgi:hypothetical protein
MKLADKIKAIQLRKRGRGYSYILKQVHVSKSTLSLWLRDVKLTDKQKAILFIGRQKSKYAGAKARQQQRIEKTKKIIEQAIEESERLSDNPLFISGLMLYWAEGDKSDVIEHTKFTNSDPIMIKLIMRWFREICKVPENKFKITMHIHTLHCRPKIEKYWSKIIGVPLSQFYRTQIKQTSLKHRRNPLYDGTCAISVQNRDLFRKIKGWKIGIAKIFKIL